MQLTPETAEILALKALAWLTSNEDLLPVFMGSTGVDADTLRAGAGTAEVQRSVLDFILLDDAWVIGFCDAHELEYPSVHAARQLLAGGEEYHWT